MRCGVELSGRTELFYPFQPIKTVCIMTSQLYKFHKSLQAKTDGQHRNQVIRQVMVV